MNWFNNMNISLLIIIWVTDLINSSENKSNNVCLRMRDYNTKRYNKNCWYNPDVDSTAVQIIENHGYPLEIYKIVTADGYILPLYRIPHGKNIVKDKNITSTPVFLQHGILSTAATWVANGNESVGFILADQGYDVWLSNSRGGTYAKGHTTYSINNMHYWNFSYYEMAIYDTPAILDKIYEVTNRKDTIFIGHSMGTNIQTVYASEFPEHAKHRVKQMIYLAPVAFLIDVKIPPARLAPIWPIIERFAKTFKIGEILSKNQIRSQVVKKICLESGLQVAICESFVFVMVTGPDFENFPPEIVPVIFALFPAGTSVKTCVHLLQAIQTKKFARYDYGNLNKKYYNSTIPPSYNLSKVEIPGHIMYGNNDWLSTEESSLALYEALPKDSNTIYKIDDPTFNHLDFFFSKNIVPALVEKMLAVMMM